tara:strand:- start:196 stop:642 length:447 start_codon:yes stop_codon:yes gene_type:complete
MTKGAEENLGNEDIVPSYLLRGKAKDSILNVVKVNTDSLNYETRWALAFIATMIDFGVWSDETLRYCLGYLEDGDGGVDSPLASSFISCIRFWQQDDSPAGVEWAMECQKDVRRILELHKQDEKSLLESVDWQFCNRLCAGAIGAMYV